MRFEHILFPIDFSERSLALNKEVEALAKHFDSRVTLLHVFEVPAAWYGSSEASMVDTECLRRLRESSEESLQKYALNVPEDRIKRVFIVGNAAAEILHWAEANRPDIIMMGTHGYGALEGWFLGSVAAKILHKAGCPVWTDARHERREADGEIRKIVAAIELTDEAEGLLRFIQALSETMGATVRLIHAVPESASRPSRYYDFDLHQYLKESARVEIAKLQRDACTNFPVKIADVDIAQAIEDEIVGEGGDLVVIGRGSAKKLMGRFFGQAFEIVRRSPCPVLSYSLSQKGHTFSSYSAGHPGRYAESVQLPTGSLRT